MKLYFAEKPSQARELAQVLGATSKQNGYLQLANGDCISWAFGHLLEQAPAHAYNSAWKAWQWETLPIVLKPTEWKLQVRESALTQFNVLKRLLSQASEVIICTDAGREGELIAREVIYFCGFKGSIKRLWASSMLEADLKKAFQTLKTDQETYPLYQAAVLRQQADWTFGISGTRAATLAFSQFKETYNLGRVQTPTLAFVVKRDLEIENFKPEEFFRIQATVHTASGQPFTMEHNPTPKITSKEEAARRVALAKNYSGPIKALFTKEKETPPLPFSLPTLQATANSKLKFSASKTLEIAQALYEKHKAISYPRSDTEYLAQSQKAEVQPLVNLLKAKFPSWTQILQTTGIVMRDSTFDDSKLTDHAALTPTLNHKLNLSDLSKDELALYSLICHRYLQSLAPDCLFNQTNLELDANGVLFKAFGKDVTSPGWTAFKSAS